MKYIPRLWGIFSGFFSRVLLKHNPHATECTCIRYAINWWVWPSSSQSILERFYYLKKKPSTLWISILIFQLPHLLRVISFLFLQIALVQKVNIGGISWSFLWEASYTYHLLMVHPCCSMTWYLIPSRVKFHWIYIAHCVHGYVWVVPTSQLLWLCCMCRSFCVWYVSIWGNRGLGLQLWRNSIIPGIPWGPWYLYFLIGTCHCLTFLALAILLRVKEHLTIFSCFSLNTRDKENLFICFLAVYN